MSRDFKKVKPLRFDWNEGNKYKNWEKHKVDFRECEEVFFNRPLKIFYDVKHSQKEGRFMALGITDKDRRLTVSFTIRGKKIRVISARDQSQKERRFCEQKTKN